MTQVLTALWSLLAQMARMTSANHASARVSDIVLHSGMSTCAHNRVPLSYPCGWLTNLAVLLSPG
jgi:hypothetical protein